MRVATRRQRAAWRVFGDSFRAGRTKRFRSGLREVAGRLGAVRDLDVLLEAADHYRAACRSSSSARWNRSSTTGASTARTPACC